MSKLKLLELSGLSKNYRKQIPSDYDIVCTDQALITLDMMKYADAVSYTHLDVYKRQI